MSQVVRLADTSDHGGFMITATADFKCNSIVACVSGDMHSCPIKNHGITPVIGTGGFKSNGRRIIKVGDVAGCGAIIIQGSTNTST